MSQKLILPFQSAKVAAGYKVPAYAKPKSQGGWGYQHYGVDYLSTGSTNVLASGAGKVVTTGYDNKVGNTVCIVYYDALSHKTGKSRDLVARYMHLASIAVKVGQTVKAGDVIGVEGATGSGGWSRHLHVELDTDTRPAYYNWSPQVAGSNLIQKTPWYYPDTTVHPSDYFHRAQGQKIANGKAVGSGWTDPGDYNLPAIAASSTSGSESDLPIANQIGILRLEIQGLEKQLTEKRAQLAALEKQK